MKNLIAITAATASLLTMLAGCAGQGVPTNMTEPAEDNLKALTAVLTEGNDSSDDVLLAEAAAAKTELIAADDYGMLYSYACLTGDGVGRFGFADKQGRVATNAVYSWISSKYTEDGSKGVWIYGKEYCADEATGRVDDLQGFAALDGSFATACRYVDITVGEDLVLCPYRSEQDDTPGFDVYDFSGKLLLSSDVLQCADRLSSWQWHKSVGQYLALALNTGEKDEFDRDAADYYLFDINEKQFAGPFLDVWQDNGYLYALKKDHTMAILDNDGNELFGRSFACIENDTPDRFHVLDTEDAAEWRILDAEGNEIFTVPVSADDSLHTNERGEYYIHFKHNGSFKNYYDLDGNELPANMEHEEVWDYPLAVPCDHLKAIVNEDTAELELYTEDMKRICAIPEGFDGTLCYSDHSVSYCADGVTYVYDTEGNEIFRHAVADLLGE